MHNTGNVSTLADGSARRADRSSADRNDTPQRLEGLLKSGALQTAILASAGFPIIATDEKGIIKIFNAGAERMLGYAAAEVVNRKDAADIHDPQEIALRAEALSRELGSFIAPGFAAMAFKASTGIENICELTCIRKDGTRFPAQWSVSALRDEHGPIVGYLLLGTDITQRKVADEELSKNAWRLRYATESARLTYVEADLVRGAARTPENFATVMGYAPPSEQETDISAGTRLLLEHVVPQDRLRVTAAHEEFLAGIAAGKVEYRILGDDKVERWIETRWTVEFSREGKPQKSFATNLDITERKHAELEVRESEERYRTLFNSMDEGHCVIEMIFDGQDKPVDWLYLEVNPAFENHSGMHNVTGKRVRELVPDLEQHWFDVYGKVALTGQPVRCANLAKAIGGRWFDVYACRVGGAGSRKVAVIFNNVTLRVQSEEALRQSHVELESHAEELDRFNRVAVRRELRLIELKKEINELHQKHGGAARYPLEFEAKADGSPRMPEPLDRAMAPRKAAPATVQVGKGRVPLESVLITEELYRRPARRPDYEMENRALVALGQALVNSPRTIIQTLVDTILEVIEAGTAGVSLLTKDGTSFEWPAISGEWKSHLGGGIPRDFSPCGDVLDRNTPLLLKRPERRFPDMLPVTPVAEECLLVPFYLEGKAVGTIWAVAHDDRRKFDAEDLRKIVRLGDFASLIYQQAVASVTSSEARRAALNLMDDAVESRNMMEKLNAELRASEVRFHVMAENIPQLAWMADANGDINWFNQRWFDFTGTTLEDNLGAGWKAVHHPDYVDGVVEKFERHIREGREWEDTFPLRGRDGRFRWFLSRMKAIRDESGKVVRFFGTNTDVTDQREIDEALRDAMAIAEKANRAKSDFLSSMSHELRTPLNAILGFAQLMESATPAPTPAQMRNLDQILKGGWYLLELINEILDLALIESGKMPLTQEVVSVAEVMLECRAMVEPQARKSGIGMTFPSFDIPGYVRADRTRLKQVLINLLSNAIKYNKPQGVVAVEWTLSPPDTIRFSVRDTGAGLAPEQIAQLFQPFNRLGKEAGAEEGTGIGLVMTKRLVELMDGAIGADSVVGVGSVFWFELKQASAPQAALQQAEGAARVRPQAPFHVSPGTPPRTVLYVEDNPANLALIEQLIARRPDLRLLSAADGNRGIELTRAHQPQVIIIDVNLPGINGIEVMRILRADPSTAHIPIMALSASALPRDIENGIEAGFFSYLTKPIKVTQFMDALDVALDFSQSALDRATGKEQA